MRLPPAIPDYFGNTENITYKVLTLSRIIRSLT